MKQEGYIWGDWIDSSGDVNRVCYKKKWGNHTFTEEENERLLSGKEISFIYKDQIVTGHLQYYFFNGKECFGFKSNYPRNEYDRFPVFRIDSRVSTFEMDLERENDVMAEYMRLHYYTKLMNKDKTRVNDYHRVTDIERQKEGIDVTYTRDGKKYIIDEKAQMDYIFNSRPLPTFALELLNGSSGATGWFINDELKTEYYMFIWPHADAKPLRVEGIRYAYYVLINKQRLLYEVEQRFHKSRDGLLEYARRMIMEKMGDQVCDKSGTCIGYKYKGDGFNDNGYLYYTLSKQERPVNLIVRRCWLEELSESYGTITNNLEKI